MPCFCYCLPAPCYCCSLPSATAAGPCPWCSALHLLLTGRFIRKVLDEVGGHNVRIISKIESSHGLVNYDAILAETDGIMVARGDLAMEIPSEKVGPGCSRWVHGGTWGPGHGNPNTYYQCLVTLKSLYTFCLPPFPAETEVTNRSVSKFVKKD